ncbi:FAD-dependent oxidoreductase [Dactylosporangium sp. NPDC051485]|uniref:NAD(P)/FAD-dependent oxidoreductase n=1 Tax=Dactylosporangium sp. NPDC051485 TaxID=3154846 RepID=UPI003419D7A5
MPARQLAPGNLDGAPVSSYDIGIIGAGVHGLSAAYHLTRRGVSTLILERGRRAGGPTGRASGVVRAYYTNRFLAEVARDSTAVLADLAGRAGDGSGYVRTGGLYLHAAGDAADVRATAAGLAAAGIGHEVLTPDDLARRFPDLNLDGTAIGVWERHAGHADPYRTALGYATRAVALGATLLEHSRVCQIVEGPRSVKLLLADGSGHEVGRLLVAAGPWTAPLVAQLGVVLPLTAERHVVAGLRHAPGDTPRAIPHVLIDVQHGYYSRPDGAGRFLLGPLAPTAATDPDAFAADITGAEHAWLAARAAHRAPVRGRAVADGGWASLYDVSPDWQPVTGRIGERVYVDAGTSGHGFKLAPVWGDHVARLLLDDADARLGQFSPGRFAAGTGLASGFGAARILG